MGFETPDRALDTFLEAARRDDSHVAYLCFSQGLVTESGIGGLEFAVIWSRLQAIHLLGNASVDGPDRASATRIEYTLRRAGYTVELQFVREELVQLDYFREGTLLEGGQYVSSFERHASLTDRGDGDFTARLEFTTLLDATSLDVDDVQRIGIAREWKIDELRVMDGEDVIIDIAGRRGRT